MSPSSALPSTSPPSASDALRLSGATFRTVSITLGYSRPWPKKHRGLRRTMAYRRAVRALARLYAPGLMNTARFNLSCTGS